MHLCTYMTMLPLFFNGKRSMLQLKLHLVEILSASMDQLNCTEFWIRH
jgi:hypothetical protein